jgi:hypothetical protein
MNKTILATLILCSLLMFSGCPGDGPTLPKTTAGGGFTIQTFTSVNEDFPDPTPQVRLGGTFKLPDLAGAQGDASAWNVTTRAEGLGVVSNGRAPANWHVTWVTGGFETACFGLSTDLFVDLHQISGLLCEVFVFEPANLGQSASFHFSPNPIHTANPPGTVTITGTGISSQNGMPLLQYYTLDGTLVNQAYATAVAGDGSWLQAPVPSLAGLQAGTYVGFIYNENADSSYSYIGTSAVDVIVPTQATGVLGFRGQFSCDPNGGQAGPCDYGTISVTVGNTTKIIGYDGYGFLSGTGYSNGNPGIPQTVAQAVADAFNGDPNSPVTASAVMDTYFSGYDVVFTTKQAGPGVNYSASVSVQSAYGDFNYFGLTSSPIQWTWARFGSGADPGGATQMTPSYGTFTGGAN